MDKNTDLIQSMAEAFITAVRALETENARLRSENELLTLEIEEARGAGDQWLDWRDELEREEELDL